MNPTTSATFGLLAPEIALVIAALVAFLGGAFAGLRSGWLVALVGIAAALVLSGGQAVDGVAVSGPLAIDGFSTFIRWLVLLLGGLVALVQAGDTFRSAVIREPQPSAATGEEAGVFLLLLAGLSLTGVADDLVLLFAGLELVSIPTALLLALKRTDAQGQEASLKYFFLSLVASSLFLYGLVCLYGIGGSTHLGAISDRLRTTDPGTVVIGAALVPLAVGLTLAGAAFRLAAFPLHFYAPDVYQGTSPGNAALLSTLPKLAGVVVLLRLAGLAIAPPTAPAAGYAATAALDLLWPAAAVLAAVSMTIGNVMALRQTNLRRLLACSSIAHAGYLLVGIAAASAAAHAPNGGTGLAGGTAAGIAGGGATLFYLATYAVATIGVFAALTYIGHRWPEWSAAVPRPPREEAATVADLDGLSGTNPVVAFTIALCLLSLAGIPPLPGFWGKLSLAAAALEVDAGGWGPRRLAFVALAVTLVVNAAIAAAYYLRIIAAMYFRSTTRGVQTDGGIGAGVGMLACLALLAFFTLRPQGLFTSARQAGAVVLRGVPATFSSHHHPGPTSSPTGASTVAAATGSSTVATAAPLSPSPSAAP
jgi:NADH-quinone oxidoreductase subunit N